MLDNKSRMKNTGFCARPLSYGTAPLYHFRGLPHCHLAHFALGKKQTIATARCCNNDICHNWMTALISSEGFATKSSRVLNSIIVRPLPSLVSIGNAPGQLAPCEDANNIIICHIVGSRLTGQVTQSAGVAET